jgi:Flp pilus assembly pilin Flp
MMKTIKQLLADSRGAAAIELGLVLGLVTLSVLGTVTGLGAGVQSSYQDTAKKVADATP